jgi:Ca2+/Na+ antiporter
MILFWIAVFVVSLIVLVKGADWLLESAEKIGLAAGLSSFVVGVVIVGLGTSFPELISGIAAVIQGAPEIVAANAIGSKITSKDIGLLILGVAGLVFGAKFLVDSVINLSEILSIATGVITLAAVALGTSLPELLVSIKAAKKGNAETALGNIFGSNAFNLLMVVGTPGLFATLPLDAGTMAIGLPFLFAATLLFVIFELF